MRIRTHAIDDDVATVLQDSTIEGDKLHLPGQLDRALYTRTAKILTALGIKWSRKDGAHLVPANETGEALREALAAGSVVDRKKTLELFETPPAVARDLVDMTYRRLTNGQSIQRSLRILEPSAGTGRLLDALKPRLTKLDEVVAVDVDPKNVDCLVSQGIATRVLYEDFLDCAPIGEPYAEPVDVVVMNPPFASNADVRHVRHAFETWLKPGGVLGAIMSKHWTFASDSQSRAFRDMLAELDHETIDIPAGAFKGEGTGIATVMVIMRKPAA